jgi:hypothetical protein
MTDNGKLQIDFGDLTLAELDELAETLDGPLADLMTGKGQFKAMAAAAWILQRRTDPTYTLEQARQLKMSDLELTSGEVPAAVPGGGPQPSPESGDLTPTTS